MTATAGADASAPTTAEEALMSLLDHFNKIVEAAAGMKAQLVNNGFSEHVAEHLVAEYISDVIIQPLGIRSMAQAEQLSQPKTAIESFFDRLRQGHSG